MTGLRSSRGESAATTTEQTWRTTTAVRAFVLAFASGQLIDRGATGQDRTHLAVLIGLAAIGCVAELHPKLRNVPALNWLEGGLTAGAVLAAAPDAGAFLVCLTVPAVVAGIRHGVPTTVATVAVAAAVVASPLLLLSLQPLPAGAGGWLVLALGGGLLGSAQSRSARRSAAAQASYTAAHRLLGQLHGLVQRQAIDLDVTSLAGALRERVEQTPGVQSCTVWVRLASQDIELLSTGDASADDAAIAGRCLGSRSCWSGRGAAAVPLQVGGHVFGAVVVRAGATRSELPLADLQVVVDEHAIRLDTALLVDGIRTSATEAERRRLAREIHDGVAQRVVSLGYLADDLLEMAAEPAVARAAEELRSEVGRVVGELRFSVFELRQDLPACGVSDALFEYVQQLSRRSSLRVHLLLDERTAPLPARVETEVVRIAQEAMANVAAHADAVNLWVRLRTDEHGLRLTVEDDGVGVAEPRPGHYGMHTMRERAEHIGAALQIGPRPDGGTLVSLRLGTAGPSHEESRHDAPRLARR